MDTRTRSRYRIAHALLLYGISMFCGGIWCMFRAGPDMHAVCIAGGLALVAAAPLYLAERTYTRLAVEFEARAEMARSSRRTPTLWDTLPRV